MHATIYNTYLYLYTYCVHIIHDGFGIGRFGEKKEPYTDFKHSRTAANMNFYAHYNTLSSLYNNNKTLSYRHTSSKHTQHT